MKGKILTKKRICAVLNMVLICMSLLLETSGLARAQGDDFGVLEDFTQRITIPPMTRAELELEFGLLTDKQGAASQLLQCQRDRDALDVLVERQAKIEADVAAYRVEADLAQARLEETRKELRAYLAAWQSARLIENDQSRAERFETTFLPPLREKYRLALEAGKRKQVQWEQEGRLAAPAKAEFRSRAAAILKLQVTSTDVAGKTDEEIYEEVFKYCARMALWANRRSEDATARPSADTENEGPPAEEALPVPQGAILQLSGKVDQGPVNAVNAREGDNAPRMKLESGTITLSFIAEEPPEGAAPGGRVVITPKSVQLTYIYDYRHAPPQQLVDRMESKCELVGANS